MSTPSWAVAVKKATAWGTSLAVGALNGLKIESDSMPEGIPEPISDDNIGDSLSGGTLQGNIGIEGTLVAPMRYEGPSSGLLMALLMGQSNDGTGPGNTTGEEIDVGASYKHYMDFQSNSDGLFCTLVIDKNTGADTQWDYVTNKVSQVELAHSNGKLVGTFTLIAHSLLRDGSVNGDVEMAAVTHETDGLLAIFNQVELRLTEITGAEDNMDSADEILVTEAKVTVNRNIAGDFESGSNAGYVGEPDINGFPEASLEFTIKDYKSGTVDTLITDAQTINTGRIPKVYKAELFWTSINIPTTSTPYEMRFMFPALTITSGPASGGSPGAKVPVTINMKVQTPQADSLPHGTEWAWAVAGGIPIRFLLTKATGTSILA
jgi:hypothetical protein